MPKRPTPAKPGRPPKLVPELVAAALVELAGNVAAVAKRFGAGRTTIRDLIDRTPALRQVCADAREGMKDNAESALYAAVLDGESWAVRFFLKTQAKDRGYVERTEVDQTNRVALEFVEEIVDPPAHLAAGPSPAAPGPG
jgi:hypothetical protein